jgi:hypothetical protein
VHAYYKVGCHIVAMEDDKAIFKALFQLLVFNNVGKVLKKQRLNPTDPSRTQMRRNKKRSLL